MCMLIYAIKILNIIIIIIIIIIENDVLFSNDTGILGKRSSVFSQQESNLRPSDY